MDASGKRTIEDILAVAMRLILASVFLYSAIGKIRDPLTFQIKVNEYDIIPIGWEHAFSIAWPWLMVAGAVLIIPGFITRLGALIHSGLLLSFLIAIGVNIYRDRVMGCGCFSEEGSPLGWGLFFQDLALFAGAVFLIARGGGRLSLDRLLFRGRQAPKDQSCDDDGPSNSPGN